MKKGLSPSPARIIQPKLLILLYVCTNLSGCECSDDDPRKLIITANNTRETASEKATWSSGASPTTACLHLGIRCHA